MGLGSEEGLERGGVGEEGDVGEGEVDVELFYCWLVEKK